MKWFLRKVRIVGVKVMIPQVHWRFWFYSSVYLVICQTLERRINIQKVSGVIRTGQLPVTQGYSNCQVRMIISDLSPLICFAQKLYMNHISAQVLTKREVDLTGENLGGFLLVSTYIIIILWDQWRRNVTRKHLKKNAGVRWYTIIPKSECYLDIQRSRECRRKPAWTRVNKNPLLSYLEWT